MVVSFGEETKRVTLWDEILDFFRKFTKSTSKDLQFVIDDLSTSDPSSVGVNGREKPFPFSKGCSFYRLEVNNGKRQIIYGDGSYSSNCRYGRDCVEPAIKPGDATLVCGVSFISTIVFS
ncbi:Peptidyl-prolyl cis-trans isomerase FKBP53 isoform E [Senna tora]|uniref:Peptidyl-prolyl cis-trans isomerase FKBP53 isoform E n=1 Tax=Senna tora TaxID=362788 RepID=A0A834WLC5_9FABA|nr:Peptidyl-prolyl cis-trans isomerase FKBP53 isoform E [Senna tora]